MTIPTCGNCYFGRESIVDGHKTLTCHRYAPQPLACGVGAGWSDWQWPVVAGDEFCGEHSTAAQHDSREDG